MGDRANCVVIDDYSDSDAVFLYSHWGGYNLPETVREALDSGIGRGRWSDCAYLTRIIFDTMTRDNHGSETGFGIATRACDNEYDFIVLRKQVVYRVPEAMINAFKENPENNSGSIPFEDYCNKPRTWENLTN